MSKRANPVLIGGFVVGTIALMVLFSVLTGNGKLSRYDRVRYELVYNTSIKGLNVGAPATLRGVKIGEVAMIKARYYSDRHDVLSSVYVDIYPDSVVQEDGPYKTNLPERLIQQGFGAQLKLQSLLTGLLYIELDFYPDQASSITVKTDYPQIPTVMSDLETFSKDVDDMDLPDMMSDLKEVISNLKAVTASNEAQNLASTLNQTLVSFETMSREVGDSFSAMSNQFVPMAKGIRLLSDNMNRYLPETVSQLNRAIVEMQKTLVAVQNTVVQMQDTLDPQSPMFYQLQQSSKDISKAARAIDSLAEMLEQQPSAIWSGRKELSQ